uniref:Uncharacterized protein n=1 Tax=Macrostomum lignano TaxID=282301 RepID=A0A1I8HV99_9PLAT
MAAVTVAESSLTQQLAPPPPQLNKHLLEVEFANLLDEAEYLYRGFRGGHPSGTLRRYHKTERRRKFESVRATDLTVVTLGDQTRHGRRPMWRGPKTGLRWPTQDEEENASQTAVDFESLEAGSLPASNRSPWRPLPSTVLYCKSPNSRQLLVLESVSGCHLATVELTAASPHLVERLAYWPVKQQLLLMLGCALPVSAGFDGFRDATDVCLDLNGDRLLVLESRLGCVFVYGLEKFAPLQTLGPFGRGLHSMCWVSGATGQSLPALLLTDRLGPIRIFAGSNKLVPIRELTPELHTAAAEAATPSWPSSFTAAAVSPAGDQVYIATPSSGIFCLPYSRLLNNQDEQESGVSSTGFELLISAAELNHRAPAGMEILQLTSACDNAGLEQSAAGFELLVCSGDASEIDVFHLTTTAVQLDYVDEGDGGFNPIASQDQVSIWYRPVLCHSASIPAASASSKPPCTVRAACTADRTSRGMAPELPATITAPPPSNTFCLLAAVRSWPRKRRSQLELVRPQTRPLQPVGLEVEIFLRMPAAEEHESLGRASSRCLIALPVDDPVSLLDQTSKRRDPRAGTDQNQRHIDWRHPEPQQQAGRDLSSPTGPDWQLRSFAVESVSTGRIIDSIECEKPTRGSRAEFRLQYGEAGCNRRPARLHLAFNFHVEPARVFLSCSRDLIADAHSDSAKSFEEATARHAADVEIRSVGPAGGRSGGGGKFGSDCDTRRRVSGSRCDKVLSRLETADWLLLGKTWRTSPGWNGDQRVGDGDSALVGAGLSVMSLVSCGERVEMEGEGCNSLNAIERRQRSVKTAANAGATDAKSVGQQSGHCLSEGQEGLVGSHRLLIARRQNLRILAGGSPCPVVEQAAISSCWRRSLLGKQSAAVSKATMPTSSNEPKRQFKPWSETQILPAPKKARRVRPEFLRQLARAAAKLFAPLVQCNFSFQQKVQSRFGNKTGSTAGHNRFGFVEFVHRFFELRTIQTVFDFEIAPSLINNAEHNAVDAFVETGRHSAEAAVDTPLPILQYLAAAEQRIVDVGQLNIQSVNQRVQSDVNIISAVPVNQHVQQLSLWPHIKGRCVDKLAKLLRIAGLNPSCINPFFLLNGHRGVTLNVAKCVIMILQVVQVVHAGASEKILRSAEQDSNVVDPAATHAGEKGDELLGSRCPDHVFSKQKAESWTAFQAPPSGEEQQIGPHLWELPVEVAHLEQQRVAQHGAARDPVELGRAQLPNRTERPAGQAKAFHQQRVQLPFVHRGSLRIALQTVLNDQESIEYRPLTFHMLECLQLAVGVLNPPVRPSAAGLHSAAVAVSGEPFKAVVATEPVEHVLQSGFPHRLISENNPIPRMGIDVNVDHGGVIARLAEHVETVSRFQGGLGEANGAGVQLHAASVLLGAALPHAEVRDATDRVQLVMLVALKSGVNQLPASPIVEHSQQAPPWTLLFFKSFQPISLRHPEIQYRSHAFQGALTQLPAATAVLIGFAVHLSQSPDASCYVDIVTNVSGIARGIGLRVQREQASDRVLIRQDLA